MCWRTLEAFPEDLGPRPVSGLSHSSFQNFFFFFFLLIAQIRISSAILNRRDANRHPRLIPDHRGKFPSLIMKSEVCCGVFIESNVIYQLRKLPPIPGSLRVFNQEREWDFIKCLLCIYHGHHTLEEEMATHSSILA